MSYWLNKAILLNKVGEECHISAPFVYHFIDSQSSQLVSYFQPDFSLQAKKYRYHIIIAAQSVC